MCVYVHASVHVLFVHVCMYMCVCEYVYMYVYGMCVRVFVCVSMRVCMYYMCAVKPFNQDPGKGHLRIIIHTFSDISNWCFIL